MTVLYYNSLCLSGLGDFTLLQFTLSVRTGSPSDTYNSLDSLKFNVSIPTLRPRFLSHAIPCRKVPRVSGARSSLCRGGARRATARPPIAATAVSASSTPCATPARYALLVAATSMSHTTFLFVAATSMSHTKFLLVAATSMRIDTAIQVR